MEFSGNIARKTGSPSLLAVEALKTERAGEIGKNSGLFYVPRVVNFDADAGVLEFERLRGLVTLLDLAIKKDQRLFELLDKTGRSLSAIHQQLALPDDMKYELPPEWMGTSDENVFIHGDFAGFNLCFDESSERLVILDWDSAPFLSRIATYGSRFFDVVWFVNYMFYGAPRQHLFDWDAPRMANAFLSGYAEHYPEIGGRLAGDLAPLMRRYYRKTVWYLTRQRPWWKAARYLLYQLLIYPRFACYEFQQR